MRHSKPERLKGVELLRWLHAARLASDVPLKRRFDTKPINFDEFYMKVCKGCGKVYSLKKKGAGKTYCSLKCKPQRVNKERKLRRKKRNEKDY